jgi:hypothetical protein
MDSKENDTNPSGHSVAGDVATPCYTDLAIHPRRYLRRSPDARSRKQGERVDPDLIGSLHRPDVTQTTSVTGAIKELLVAVDLMSRGHQVFRNMAPSGVDLVAMINGQLYKIEVCTGARGSGRQISYPLKAEHYQYDIIAAVLPDYSIHYFWKTTPGAP